MPKKREKNKEYKRACEKVEDKLIHRQNSYNNTDLTPHNASGKIYIENFEIKYK